jgi:hypothetical protein
MREKLCTKEDNWNEAFKAKDWLVGQLRWLHDSGLEDATTKQDMIERLKDILCVLDPDCGDENEQ